MPGRWYSIKEAAEALGVSHDTVGRLVERGELPAIRVSERLIRIPVPALDRYMSGSPPERRTVVHRRVTRELELAPGERLPVEPTARVRGSA